MSEILKVVSERQRTSTKIPSKSTRKDNVELAMSFKPMIANQIFITYFCTFAFSTKLQLCILCEVSNSEIGKLHNFEHGLRAIRRQDGKRS
jgi:hypothetical protein